MPRREQDREDLLRDAKALIERGEFRLDGFPENVVVGFRRDGSASFYFGQALVFQFNSQSELRRGFLNGRPVIAEQGRLLTLTRQQAPGEVQLVRHSMTEPESRQFLAMLEQRLLHLGDALRDGKVELLGQVPEQGAVTSRIEKWLATCPRPVAIASRPHAQ